MTDKFTLALTSNASEYGIELSAETVRGLVDYYALLTRWNDRLHLVAPCRPEEFATRHVLESLLLLRFLPEAVGLADVGSGAGLPVIPCLIAKPDLSATLIESSQKKSVFLREAINQLGLAARGQVVAKPFEETHITNVSFITCRALDQFTQKLPMLISWAPVKSTLLLLGGESVRRQLDNLTLHYTEFLVPFSERRFVFEVRKD